MVKFETEMKEMTKTRLVLSLRRPLMTLAMLCLLSLGTAGVSFAQCCNPDTDANGLCGTQGTPITASGFGCGCPAGVTCTGGAPNDCTCDVPAGNEWQYSWDGGTWYGWYPSPPNTGAWCHTEVYIADPFICYCWVPLDLYWEIQPL